jgi:hypothetical protein
MSIFSLAPILAIALIKHSFAASLTATSSSCSASISLSKSLRSPALTVRLCVVSMFSSLAHRSHISLSMAGSIICLPLLLGISLSSGGSGVCMSLLLGGMVNYLFFFAPESKEPFLGSDTNLTLTPATSQPAGRKVHVNTGSFLYTVPKSFALALLFSFRKICTHNKSSWDPVFALRRSNFMLSRVRRSSVGLLNPQNLKTINADLSSFLFRIFLIAILAIAMSRNSSPRLPNLDFLKLRYTREL